MLNFKIIWGKWEAKGSFSFVLAHLHQSELGRAEGSSRGL